LYNIFWGKTVLIMVWIWFRTWIRNRCSNRTVTKVGTGTAINRYGSTTLPCCHKLVVVTTKKMQKRQLSEVYGQNPLGKVKACSKHCFASL
jgi:hypothetical protein